MDLRRITGSGTGESARTGVTGSVSSTVTFTGAALRVFAWQVGWGAVYDEPAAAQAKLEIVPVCFQQVFSLVKQVVTCAGLVG